MRERGVIEDRRVFRGVDLEVVVSPSFRIAAIPAGIESWRKPVVRENTSARNRASGSSAPKTVTVTVRVRSSVPSDTVTLASYVPAVV